MILLCCATQQTFETEGEKRMVNVKKLKMKMLETDYNQPSLAKELGINQASLSLKLCQKRSFSLEEAKIMFDVMKMTEDEFKEIFLQ